MGTLTLIIGLCGSGKSYLASELSKEHSVSYIHDEGFNNNLGKYYPLLIDLLKKDVACFIIESEYCFESNREAFLKKILEENLTNFNVDWKCFENNVEKAKNNILKRKNKDNPNGHIEINERLSKHYTYPQDIEPIPITLI